VALGASALVTVAATWAYDEYVCAGQKAGESLATRVGLCRALQILGLSDELPPGTAFDIVRNGAPTIHLALVNDKGQWYFTASHSESWYWSWLSWQGDAQKTVEDIRLGQCPAYHTPKAPAIPADLQSSVDQRMQLMPGKQILASVAVD
jgi:hypothetical protein